MADHANSLTDNFNSHSGGGNLLGHVAQHVVVMGAMMGVIALASPMAAGMMTIGGADPITLGDLVVQTAHGSWEMLGMIGDTLMGLVDIGGDLISNTLDGNIAPQTLDSLVMSHEAGAHVMTEGMSHGGGWFDNILRDLNASGGLGYAIEDSQALGITLEEHLMNEYGHEGH
jgi:hypothetical protein